MSIDPHIPRPKIRAILLSDWDPSNASRFEAASGEYDRYIDPLWALIKSDGAEDAIIEYLFDREREIMCFPGLGKQRLRHIARRLIALRESRLISGD